MSSSRGRGAYAWFVGRRSTRRRRSGMRTNGCSYAASSSTQGTRSASVEPCRAMLSSCGLSKRSSLKVDRQHAAMKDSAGPCLVVVCHSLRKLSSRHSHQAKRWRSFHRHWRFLLPRKKTSPLLQNRWTWNPCTLTAMMLRKERKSVVQSARYSTIRAS